METRSSAIFLIPCMLLATATLVTGADRIVFFGDSYLDTGNRSPPPPEPYGETWPGKPAGRYSDGYVFTDVFTTYLQVSLPVEYIKLTDSRTVSEGGVNYAVAGAKAISRPESKANNLSVQISQFEDMLSKGSFGKKQNYIAVINIGGNDYNDVKTITDRDVYTPLVTKILGVINESVQRLLKCGVQTYYLMNLPPAGCLPAASAIVAYTDCVDRFSRATSLHNSGLRDIRASLEVKGADATILDIERSINAIVANPRCFGYYHVLSPCCVGVTLDYNKLSLGCTEDSYSVCDRPERRLFFDSIHPTDAGWRSIISLFAIGNNFTHPVKNLCTKLNKTCEGNTDMTIPALPVPIDGGNCNVTDIYSPAGTVIPLSMVYGLLSVLGLGFQLYYWF